MTSSKYYLRWTDHATSIVEMFTTMMQCNSLVDCTLAAEGQFVKAHRLILSATSPYFQSLFDMEGDKHPIIFLKDVKYTIVMAIMDYIYSGEVNVSEDLLEEFFVTAQSLQIKGLTSYSGSDIVDKTFSDETEAARELEEFISRSEDIEKVAVIFEEPETNDDNLMNQNNSSPSLDHQYCAENDDNSSSSQIVLSESASAPGKMNDSVSLSQSTKASSPRVLPMVYIPSAGTDEIKQAKPKDNNQIIHKPKRSVVIQPRSRSPIENIANKAVKKFVTKAPLIASQPSKISQKSGTIIISKPPGMFTSNLIQKPKIVTTTQKRQAVIIGNKVLAVPRPSVFSGTKDWLQPPKEKPIRGNEKLYPCPDCKKVFRKPSILSSHRRTHTGEKPYQCTDCGRMFNQSSNFRRHQRAHYEERIRGPNARHTLKLVESI